MKFKGGQMNNLVIGEVKDIIWYVRDQEYTTTAKLSAQSKLLIFESTSISIKSIVIASSPLRVRLLCKGLASAKSRIFHFAYFRRQIPRFTCMQELLVQICEESAEASLHNTSTLMIAPIQAGFL